MFECQTFLIKKRRRENLFSDIVHTEIHSANTTEGAQNSPLKFESDLFSCLYLHVKEFP